MEHGGRFDPIVILQSPTSLCRHHINNGSDSRHKDKGCRWSCEGKKKVDDERLGNFINRISPESVLRLIFLAEFFRAHQVPCSSVISVLGL